MSPRIQHLPDQPILDVHHLSVKYGDRLILDNLTFHLHAGERIAVVGPNGAGKSTLFKVITGVLPPSRGEVRVYGSGPLGHVCIGYVPQRSLVDWRFPVSVADVVMMGRIARLGWLKWPKKADWALVDDALETVGLRDLRGRQISQLSGGQQQRMFIAQVLAQEAELMLMDEPFSGLDAPSKDGILSLLETLQEKHVTVMISTHDLDEAARYYDRVMLLNKKILGFGDAETVLNFEALRKAYGGRLRKVEADVGTLTVADACCGDGEEHEHAH